MNSTMVKDFQNRIVHAGQTDLLLINYEMLLVTINEAIKAIEDNQKDVLSKSMTQAQKLLRELIDNLDFQYDISKNLMAIYIYVNKQFINASITMEIDSLKNASSILTVLFNGWEAASKKQVGQRPVVSNAQKVYAGLTYGRGSTLNETIYDGTNSRGFKA